MQLFNKVSTNISSAEFNSKISDQFLIIDGTWDGATVTLEVQNMNGDWVAVTDAAYTDNTAKQMLNHGNASTRTFRLTISGVGTSEISAEIS